MRSKVGEQTTHLNSPGHQEAGWTRHGGPGPGAVPRTAHVVRRETAACGTACLKGFQVFLEIVFYLVFLLHFHNFSFLRSI